MLKKLFSNLHYYWSFNFQAFLVYISLALLALTSGLDFFKDQDFTQTLTIYLTFTALSIALSACLFSYYGCVQGTHTKDKIKKTGQLFLYSSICMIMALLISWLSFSVREFIQGHSYELIVSPIASFLFASNYMFLIFSVNSIYEGLKILEEYLFFELKDEIK